MHKENISSIEHYSKEKKSILTKTIEKIEKSLLDLNISRQSMILEIQQIHQKSEESINENWCRAFQEFYKKIKM